MYFKQLPKDTLSKTNTVQEYDGEQYATVLTEEHYLNDKNATIIHELFHRLQNSIHDAKGLNLKADPVVYLDEYDARIWLRLEFQALKNALAYIDRRDPGFLVFVNDALIFRKLRQTRYRQFLKEELEIETVEGLAEYTGIAMSGYANKYQKTIDSINGRERASTYHVLSRMPRVRPMV